MTSISTSKTLPFSRREQAKLERFAAQAPARDAQGDRSIWFDTTGLTSASDADAPIAGHRTRSPGTSCFQVEAWPRRSSHHIVRSGSDRASLMEEEPPE